MACFVRRTAAAEDEEGRKGGLLLSMSSRIARMVKSTHLQRIGMDCPKLPTSAVAQRRMETASLCRPPGVHGRDGYGIRAPSAARPVTARGVANADGDDGGGRWQQRRFLKAQKLVEDRVRVKAGVAGRALWAGCGSSGRGSGPLACAPPRRNVGLGHVTVQIGRW